MPTPRTPRFRSLTAVLAVTFACLFTQPARAIDGIDYEHWMTDFAPYIENYTLKELVIPGTHDSATDYLDETSRLIIDDKNKFWEDVVDTISVIKPYVAGWSRAQSQSVTAQLNGGVRFLDLRIIEADDGQLYAWHGLLGVRAEDLLDDIEEWVRTPGHEKEIVILSFGTRIPNDNGHWSNFLNSLRTRFSDILIPPTTSTGAFTGNVTPLKDIWASGKRVIVQVGNAIGHSGGVWKSRSIYSPWPDEADLEPLSTAVRNNLSAGAQDYVNGGAGDVYATTPASDRLFVLQIQPSPKGGTIALGLINPFQTTLKQLNTNVGIPMAQRVWEWWFHDQHNARANMNIIVSDFYEDTKVVQMAIVMNVPILLTNVPAPVITPTVSGDTGIGGWYTSDVTVSWSIHDPFNTIISKLGCDTTTTVTDTAGTTLACSITFTGGSTFRTVSFKRDATGPVAAMTVTAGAPGANGWYTSPVTITTTGSDDVTGPATCSYDQTQSDETAGVTFHGSCRNDAGLDGFAPPLTIKLDKSAPTAALSVTAGTAGSNGWYTSPVTVTTEGSDSISGPVICIADQSVGADTAGTLISGSCRNQAGMSTDAVPLTVKVDQTAPTVSLNATGQQGANGWYTGDVTVTTSGVETTSGPTTCTADANQTAETAAKTFDGSCTNDAGLTGNAAPFVVKLDKSAPTASLAITAGTLGSNGWYTSDVTVETTGTESISGPVTCTENQNLTAETTEMAVNGSCTNQAGLATPAAPLSVKIDKSAPVVALAVTAGTPGANGWYTSDVTIATVGSETISGPASCTAEQDQTTETTGSVFQGACTNEAGLTADALPLSVKVDKSGPTALLAVTGGILGNNGWYRSDVIITATGGDDISGPVACSPAVQMQTHETAGVDLNATCMNTAGLTTAASTLSVKLDRTAPSVLYSGNAGTYSADQTVNITCVATDNLSGAGPCAPVSGPAYSFGVGERTFSGIVTDGAGNSTPTAVTFTVTVDYVSLANVVRQLVTHTGIANSLIAKLEAASRAEQKGKDDSSLLEAFRKEVDAQTGKKISSSVARILLDLAAHL